MEIGLESYLDGKTAQKSLGDSVLRERKVRLKSLQYTVSREQTRHKSTCENGKGSERWYDQGSL